ncbi:MAG TPA: uroporphyrinogen decarboxylase family protein [Candidatus Bathyarchaeia archaeon]|nr:uroporphyrinogen decarboxylase family protein [Candidatus Bathyarchaeia archaeon]
MVRSKIDMLQAMLKGEKIEPTPFAMWRHFPVDDLHAERLARKQVDYLRKFDSIFMKVSPNGRFCVIDWGCEIAFDENRLSGSSYCTNFRIKSIDDWSTLEELDVTQGMFGEQLKALELINKEIEGTTPFIETIFNPLMTAAKLVEKQGAIVEAIKNNPKGLHEGLKTITKVLINFAKVAIENGASGVFLATQEATHDLLSIENYKEFSMKYDLELLKAIEKEAKFNVMHIHGENIMFDLIAQNYPVQALNWHDQLTKPKIAEAVKKFNGLLVGGIEEKEFLYNSSIEEITSKLQKEIDSVNGERLIIAPGCVIPINIPDKKIQAIINHIKN